MIKIIKENKVYHLYLNQKDVWLSEDEIIKLQNLLNNISMIIQLLDYSGKKYPV